MTHCCKSLVLNEKFSSSLLISSRFFSDTCNSTGSKYSLSNWLSHSLSYKVQSNMYSDPDWLSEMQYAICGLLEPVLSRALRFRRARAVRSWKALCTRLDARLELMLLVRCACSSLLERKSQTADPRVTRVHMNEFCKLSTLPDKLSGLTRVGNYNHVNICRGLTKEG